MWMIYAIISEWDPSSHVKKHDCNYFRFRFYVTLKMEGQADSIALWEILC